MDDLKSLENFLRPWCQHSEGHAVRSQGCGETLRAQVGVTEVPVPFKARAGARFAEVSRDFSTAPGWRLFEEAALAAELHVH